MAQATMIGNGTPTTESILQVRNTIKTQQSYTHMFLDKVRKGGPGYEFDCCHGDHKFASQ